jgi:hypothetical protein
MLADANFGSLRRPRSEDPSPLEPEAPFTPLSLRHERYARSAVALAPAPNRPPFGNFERHAFNAA